MLRRIDSLSYRGTFSGRSPFWKSGFAAVMFVTAYIGHPLVQVAVWMWLALWTIRYGGIPWKPYASLTAASLLFYMLSLPALLIEAAPSSAQGMVLLGWGEQVLLVTPEAVVRAEHLLLRVGACLSCFLFLILTTPFAGLLKVMEKLRLPAVVIELTLIMYRFLFLLGDTASGMMLARSVRGGSRGFRAAVADTAALAGRLFAKTMERYRGAAIGFAVRGYEGTIRMGPDASTPMPTRYRAEGWIGTALLAGAELLFRVWN
ncbi:cobalt ECF transporter T component CbiQ [Paenibacillus sp. P96]|uniref:Cobalt ECF transporter T component CbiQ n=1 Tax=Paenibacillus zeirhizosphaerae TaxID=2987519 RepID=A0ABT9FNT3_9BACL|nr:cobalt ECF transporter T component CbiQ [Paenibacillus sp. P96]MDP4096161.1 cobalt ECF transporter T component CbiQ [Paenibacillus sp. P96]